MPKQDAPIVPAEAVAGRIGLLAALREVLPQSTPPGPGDGIGASDDPVYPQTIR